MPQRALEAGWPGASRRTAGGVPTPAMGPRAARWYAWTACRSTALAAWDERFTDAHLPQDAGASVPAPGFKCATMMYWCRSTTSTTRRPTGPAATQSWVNYDAEAWANEQWRLGDDGTVFPQPEPARRQRRNGSRPCTRCHRHNPLVASVVTCEMWGSVSCSCGQGNRRRRRPRCASDTSWSYRKRSAPGCTP